MKLLADLHTHSKNSRFGHGKNTIEEMAIEANEIGLVEIGITDHGYSHFFRTSKSKLKEARKIVDEINTWSKTKVLLGVEADIIKEDGTLDIDNETLAMLDILIVGYHRMIFTDFANFFGKAPNTPEAKQKCTNAFINAIKRYPVTIVSHLDSVLTTDLYEIGKVCQERGTLVEINNRHTKWTEKQVNDLVDSGCLFVISSDAHARKKVGEVDRALEYIKKYNIPSERIANIEFNEEEKSEIDKAYTVYKSLYDKLETAKKQKEEAYEKKAQTEITGKLSNEMEEKLKAIAEEKGLDYETAKPRVVENVREKISFDDHLFGQARDYIKENKFNSIRGENDIISQEDDADETQFSFSDDHPLVKDDFANKFQAINTVIKQSKGDEEIQELDTKDYKSHVQNNSGLSAYEQLNLSTINQGDMQNLKNIMAGSASTERVTIEKNDDYSANKANDGVSQGAGAGSIVQPKPAEENSQNHAENTQKPAKHVNKRGGAFIMVDNLLDDETK